MPLLFRPEPNLTPVPYQRRFRSAVRDLLQISDNSHTHLDWHDVTDWLDAESAPIRLMFEHNRLIGVMAASAPLHQSGWIRLAAVAPFVDPLTVLKPLWEALRGDCISLGMNKIAWLMIREWPIPYMPSLGFRELEQIVTLRRANQTPPQSAVPGDILIRPVRTEDIETLAEVDQAAFAPPWQMSISDVRQAERMASNCTVATHNGKIVGYQLSTLYFDGAHLARLAVLPSAQGMGVGSALVGEVLRHYARRGVYAMTVNTQESNVVSQHIYLKFGFRRNGFDLPAWVTDL